MAIRSLQAAEEWMAAARESEHFDAEAAIGAQIRELRKIKGFTLQQVAGEAGISVGYLSQIERNQSKLPIGLPTVWPNMPDVIRPTNSPSRQMGSLW